MKSALIETHAHLDMASFDKDRAEVIIRARDIGVSTIITVGTDLASSRKAIRLADEYPGILATVGFHPHESVRVRETDITSLAEIANHPKAVAIGEAGLDYYRNKAPRETQLQALNWQLELAARLGMPIIIHCRQAQKDMLSLLHDWASTHDYPKRQPRGVIHCFSDNLEVAQQYLAIGFYLSFGAYIGYPSSTHLRAVIQSIPQDRIVLETDSPFLPPQSHRGKRNEPSYLPLVAQLVADIRETSQEAVTEETTQNARRLFRLAE